jgi:hypothetical protein
MFRCDCNNDIKLTEEDKALLDRLKSQVKPEQWQQFEASRYMGTSTYCGATRIETRQKYRQ